MGVTGDLSRRPAHSPPSLAMLLQNPRVRTLVYWDNPRDSGVTCGSVLVCLLAVRYISLISVLGNLSLALVTATMSFRIYKSVLAAVNKTHEGHPFNSFLATVKSVLLVENIIESTKFAVAMYVLSYVGVIMTGLTLLTITWVSLFSLPRLYRDNQKQIDEAILPLKTKLDG